MEIKRTQKEEQTSLISVKVGEKDYGEAVEKSLRDYRRKANIPGFRPGMVPMGIIKKMYGKGVVAEQSYRTASNAVFEYLQKENIDYLGDVIPAEEQGAFDFDNDTEFEHMFEIGEAPKIDLALSAKDKVTYHRIKIDKQMHDNYRSNFLRRYGRLVDVEKVADDEALTVTLDNGELRVEDAYVGLISMNDEERKPFKGKKVGIVVKGCDSRGVVELLQENLINREDVVVFGMGCNGTIDINRVLAKIGDVTEVESVTGSGATLKVRADGKDYEFAMQDVAQDKCRACTVPNAVIHDHFAGSPTNIPDGAQPAMPAIMTFLDGLSLEDRMGFWRGHIDRCIRCYACRNACPMCVCRDNCVADSREPHWLTQEDSPTQKMFFQLIHAMHLAGRCTGCGECNRACPMGIPVGALKLQMGRVVKKLFEYAPGMDVDAVPPLLGFQLEEKNIHEHHIEGA